MLVWAFQTSKINTDFIMGFPWKSLKIDLEHLFANRCMAEVYCYWTNWLAKHHYHCTKRVALGLFQKEADE